MVVLEALVVIGGVMYYQNRKKRKQAEREQRYIDASDAAPAPPYTNNPHFDHHRYSDNARKTDPNVAVNPVMTGPVNSPAPLPPHDRGAQHVGGVGEYPPPPSYGSLDPNMHPQGEMSSSSMQPPPQQPYYGEEAQQKKKGIFHRH